MSNMATYTDSRGETWTEVPGTRGVILADADGETFSIAWVDDHFGPLDPGTNKALWTCPCGRGFEGIRAYRLHYRRCQKLPSAERKATT